MGWFKRRQTELMDMFRGVPEDTKKEIALAHIRAVLGRDTKPQHKLSEIQAALEALDQVRQEEEADYAKAQTTTG